MTFLRISLGATRRWMAASLLLGLLFIFAPTIGAGLWRIGHPRLIHCGTFTLHLSTFWTGENIDAQTVCKSGFVLLKFGATVFGSDDNGSSLTVIPYGGRGETVFRQTHAGAAPIAYKFNDSFTQCILVEQQPTGRAFVAVFCSDKDRGLDLIFSGSRNALDGASNLIR